MKEITNKDIYFMQQALKCAQLAQEKDEVPVGAVIVKDNKIIAKGFNKSISLKDATAHAEIVAIRKACKKLNNYRLTDCSIYVTIEPCSMCMGALILARIKNLYFGAKDIKAGACGSILDISKIKTNHKINVYSGLLEQECATIIKQFFKNKRTRG
ncbi:MAG: tRNA adenosine(34) deaminase TadA [Endomicrobiaceae bacterium]|nr:tRNA adenosine(34) deaminase TadA [Endomicrobiaceae bacterium]